jgi:hypothetical protein
MLKNLGQALISRVAGYDFESCVFEITLGFAELSYHLHIWDDSRHPNQ